MNDIAQKKSKFESIVTPEFRVSYPALFTPALPMGETDEKKAKYGVTMLFAPGTDISALKTLARNAAIAKWGPDNTKWPVFKHSIFRSGGEIGKKDVPGYGPGVIFAQAKSSSYNKKTGQKMLAPGVVSPDCKIIIDPSEVYGGCYGKAKISAFAYSNQGNNGISFGLISFQKTKDGERFGNKSNPENDFDAIDTPKVDASVAGTGNDDDGGLGL
jgi:hypothetical protein